MANKTLDEAILSCDREPIHLSGAIQPHGILLVVGEDRQTIVGQAGDLGRFLGRASLLNETIDAIFPSQLLRRISLVRQDALVLLGRYEGGLIALNAVAYLSNSYLVIELELAEDGDFDAVDFLIDLEASTQKLETSGSIKLLCEQASHVFQEMTGYDRVMIYRFLDDESGVVVGESLKDHAHSFLNHHFPGGDIPKQARALYVRNRSRVIPDVSYAPEAIVSAPPHNLTELDLSDSILRSVSPVHIQYLKNMNVGASASFSIVKDGILWGLVACHHKEPKHIPLTVRVACQTLCNAIARQINSKEGAELSRARIRLRSHEDRIVAKLGSDVSLDRFFQNSGDMLAKLMGADGFAAVQGAELYVFGVAPEPDDIRAIADFVRLPASQTVFSTGSLSRRLAGAAKYADKASGLMAVTMSTEVPTILMWFRAEHIELVKWAGNPHKDVAHDSSQRLVPRASFEAWTEDVRRKARLWSHAEVESASRVVKLILDHRNNVRMRELNRELTTSLRENESLLEQKDYLLREVNHRVQNSLQLVSAFLRLQARATDNAALQAGLGEAQNRLNAVALVHRRLYQDCSVEIIDLSRYIESLVDDMFASMDPLWREQLTLDIAPILITTDKAVNIGLILTELVINVQKYAYGGQPGPILLRVDQHLGKLRLTVADQGKGKKPGEIAGSGFGSRLLLALMERLSGEIAEEDNHPGLKVVVSAPLGNQT